MDYLNLAATLLSLKGLKNLKKKIFYFCKRCTQAICQTECVMCDFFSFKVIIFFIIINHVP